MAQRKAQWKHRTEKRKQAEARQAESAKLTVDQRIAKLNAGRQRAIKERAKLLVKAQSHKA